MFQTSRHILRSTVILSALALAPLLAMPASAWSVTTEITEDTDERNTSHDIVEVAAGISYKGCNVTIGNTDEPRALFSAGGKSIHLTADEGYNSIVGLAPDGFMGYLVELHDMQEASTIERTRMEANMSNASDVYAITLKDSDLYMGNVEMRQIDATATSGHFIAARLIGDSVLTNMKDGQILGSIYIEANVTSAVVPLFNTAGLTSVVDLHDTTIVIGPAQRNNNSIFGGRGTMSLTDSTIEAQSGDNLVSRISGTVNFHNVDLSNAKNTVISENNGVINLSGDTHFDGYAITTGAAYKCNINIFDGASWNVTQDSELMQGKLTLDGTSTISFVSDEGGFTNINLAVALLEEGSILQLDKNADAFSPGDIITLFTGAAGDDFTNLGALLMSADGFSLDYIDLDNGQFLIPGVQIPEPSACLFGFAALVSTVLSRRRA